jgi:MoaA/NifB/PqqE/SkfB family radical SAM enzyme
MWPERLRAQPNSEMMEPQRSPSKEIPLTVSSAPTPAFLWLDITRRCQQTCPGHCYNDSGPRGTHGVMATGDWLRVIREAHAAGVGQVTFIGGEPTLHPDLPRLVDEALRLGLTAGIFTNLVHVTDALWETFRRPGVTLATSYYSPDPDQHARATGRPTHARIRANIARALGYGIPLRACIVRAVPGQDVDGAAADLRTLGVTDISVEDVRPFGRGQRAHEPCDTAGLCGHCGRGRAAVGPDGTVTPCIMAGWLGVGNVLQEPLEALLHGPAMAEALEGIPWPVAGRGCPPNDGDDCGKNAPACAPAFSSPPPVPPQPKPKGLPLLTGRAR